MKLLGNPSQSRRILLALGLAFASITGAAYAGTPSADLSAAISIYNTAFPKATIPTTGSLTTVTSSQAADLIAIITSGTGYPATSLNLPGDGPADVTYILQNIAPGNIASAAGKLVTAWHTSAAGDLNGTAIISGTFGQLTAAAAAAANLELAGDSVGTSALDSAENTIIGDGITAAPSDLLDILVKSFATYDPNPVDQAELITAKATATALGAAGTTISAVTQAIAANDSAFIANTGTFLYTLAVKDSTSTGPASRQGAIEGFTTNDTTTQINAIADGIGVAEANSNSSFSGNPDILVALVTSGSNSTAGNSVPTVVADVTDGLLLGVVKSATGSEPATYQTDSARGALASTFISLYPGYANDIAAAVASVIEAPATDAFLVTVDLTGNATVKATATGSNSILGVAEAVADQFPLTDVTVSNSTNIEAKEGAAEAGIKELGSTTVANGGTVGAIAADIANQVLTTATTSAAKITFATNFITALDTKATNTSSINALSRAYVAIGLAQDYDTAGIANAAGAIAEAAVKTYDSSVSNLNSVAQPILQAYATTSATEAESIAAAIAQDSDPYGNLVTTYNPGYVAAQLILASRQPNATPNSTLDQTIIGEVAIGLLTSSTDVALLGGSDGAITALGYNLGSGSALTALKYVENDLVSTGSFGGTVPDTKVISDLAATGGAPVSETGTLAAILTLSNPGDATKLAYAAAAGTGLAAGSAGDAARYLIAQDVIKNSTGAVPSISGSVGSLISVLDKPTFGKDVLQVDPSYLADVSSITLNIAQSIPTTDTNGSGNLLNDIAAVGKSTIAELGSLASADKTAADEAPIIENLVTGYTGALASGVATPGALPYGQVAALAGILNTDESSVSGLQTALVNYLVPTEINVTTNGNTAGVASAIAAQFETSFPSGAQAIATASTAGALYGGTVSAELSGSIGAAIAVALPSTGSLASKAPALSGSVALIVAEAATIPQGKTLDDSLSTVAGVFGSSSVPTTDYTTIALDLAGAAGSASQLVHDSAIPAIISAFTANATFDSSSASSNSLAALLKTIVVTYPESAADTLGAVILATSGVSGAMSPAALEAEIIADFSSSDYTTLENLGFGPFYVGMTSAQAKAELTNLLNTVVADNPLVFEPIATNPDETPIVNM